MCEKNSSSLKEGEIITQLAKCVGVKNPPPPSKKNPQVAQWATVAHLGACIMFGDPIIDDAQVQETWTWNNDQELIKKNILCQSWLSASIKKIWIKMV